MTARQRLLLGVLLTAGGGYALLQSLVVPALPTLRRELHTSATGATWVFTAFLLAACVATPLASRLGDLHGKKRLLVAVLLALATGTLIAALASSLPVLVLGRVIQGVGGAVFPLAFGIIRDELPRAQVAGGIASMTAVLGMGGVIGIILAGPILDKLSYHWLFWMPLPVIAFSLVATVVVVPESRVRAVGSLSWPGALLFSGSLVCLLIAVSKAPDWGWGSRGVIGLMLAAVTLALAWLRTERRARHPFVDLRVLAREGAWTTNLVAVLLGWGMYSGFVLIPQFVQEPESTGYGFGVSVTQAGLFLLPWTAAMLVASPLGARMAGERGSEWLLAVGSAVGVGGFVFLLAAHGSEWEVLVASAVIGTGVGLAFASLANLVVETVPQTETSVASGVNIIARTLGGVVGTQVAVSVVATTITASGFPTLDGYIWVFAISAVALALATITSLRAPYARARAHATAASSAPRVASERRECGELAPGAKRQPFGGERILNHDAETHVVRSGCAVFGHPVSDPLLRAKGVERIHEAVTPTAREV